MVHRRAFLLTWTVFAGVAINSPISAQSSSIRTAAATTTNAGDQRLTTVLSNWTTLGQRIETFSCRFVRSDFDLGHQVESRGQGTIACQSDGRAVYSIEPVKDLEKLHSSRANSRGQPFRLDAAKGETLYWISGQIARINPDRWEYELFEVPEDFQHPGVVETLESFDVVWTRLGCIERQVPGLIERDVERLNALYDWSLESVSERQIILKGLPKHEAEKHHCSMLVVYLDPKTYLTQGTKIIDSAQSRETVHVFMETKVNAMPVSTLPSWAPNIGGMTMLTPPPLAPPAEEE
ncbi:MAG: hypothetical protein ACK5Q5_02405 [Planctomycetaceae bacterium]